MNSKKPLNGLAIDGKSMLPVFCCSEFEGLVGALGAFEIEPSRLTQRTSDRVVESTYWRSLAVANLVSSFRSTSR